mmetsp:Transcript_24842/g.37191  ORF Transcript_24842/g.37191 Transcript_24842/m.37191 type:complete len:149 (-) Transcript_24842:15-461(-)
MRKKKTENKKIQKNTEIDLTANSNSEKKSSRIVSNKKLPNNVDTPAPKKILKSAKSGLSDVKVAVIVPPGVRPGQRFNVKWKDQLFATICPSNLGPDRRVELYVPSKKRIVCAAVKKTKSATKAETTAIYNARIIINKIEKWYYFTSQ